MSGMLRPRSVANPVILSHDFGGCEKQKIMVCQVWFQPSISSKLNTQSRGWQVISSHHSWFVGTVSARFSHQIWPDPIIHMRPAIRLPTKQRAGFTSLRRNFFKMYRLYKLVLFYLGAVYNLTYHGSAFSAFPTPHFELGDFTAHLEEVIDPVRFDVHRDQHGASDTHRVSGKDMDELRIEALRQRSWG